MKNKNYRVRPYDLGNDIYLLQTRFLWLFWRTIGVGPKSKMGEMIKNYETLDVW